MTIWQDLDRIMTKIDIWIKKNFGGLQIEAVKAKQIETPKRSSVVKVRDFGTNTDQIKVNPRPKNTTVELGFENAKKSFIGSIPQGESVKEAEVSIPTGFDQKPSTMRKKGVN